MFKRLLIILALFLIPIFAQSSQSEASDVYVGTTRNQTEWYVREETLDYGPTIRVIGVRDGKTMFDDILLFRKEAPSNYQWKILKPKNAQDKVWREPSERHGSIFVLQYLLENWYSQFKH